MWLVLIIRVQTRARLGVALAIALFVLCSCGSRSSVIFRSPSEAYALELRQPRIMPEADLTVILIKRNGESQRVLDLGHEMFMDFAHVYWSPNEERVALLACGTDVVQFAYDLKTSQRIPYALMEKDLKASIESSYPKPKDPRIHSTYCQVSEWRYEFRIRHPGAVYYE